MAEEEKVKVEGEGEEPKPETGEKDDAAKAASTEPDWKDLYAHTLADFDNYKKRAARDREDTYLYAERDILKDVLPALDNLALALAKAPGKGGAEAAAPSADAVSGFVKGVSLVYDAMLAALKAHGAEPFDSVGMDLDTEKMEAIAHLPSADVAEGKVSIESKKGWMLKGKVLRAAQVVVSAGKPGGAEAAAPAEEKKC